MKDQTVSKKGTLQNRLRIAREAAGLSQGQVAKLLDVHRPTISEIEAGNRKVSVEEISRFARLYDVKVSWLIDEKSAGEEGFANPRLKLAARELSKLRDEDLERLLKLISAMKEDE